MRVTYRYFRRSWDESRDDEFAAWGPATYYFETDDALVPSRQIEAYDGGQRLCYDDQHPEDEYGFLSGWRIFPEGEDEGSFEITALEFEAEWSKGSQH